MQSIVAFSCLMMAERVLLLCFLASKTAFPSLQARLIEWCIVFVRSSSEFRALSTMGAEHLSTK